MLPTFLGIGSARCASTWLYQSLRHHPDILMTGHKEVTFFGKGCLQETLADYRGKFERPPADQPRPRIRGDISPAYARLSAPSVEAVRRVLPDAQIILLIRNPIDRAWSQTLLELAAFEKCAALSRVPASHFLRRFERRRVLELSDYGPIIDRWSARFGSALHVETYDRVCHDPSGALGDILRHIGADPSRLPETADVRRRVWTIGEVTSGQSETLRMPELVRWYLAMQWRDPVRRLNDRLGGRVSGWVREIEEVTAKPAPLTSRLRRLANRTLITLPERLAYAAYTQVREWRLARAYGRLDRELAGPAAQSELRAPAAAESMAQQLITRLSLAGTVAVVIGTMAAIMAHVVAMRDLVS